MSSLDTSPILQTAASGDARLLRAQLRARALCSLYYFDKVVLNFNAIAPGFHLKKIQEVQESIWIRHRGFLWPRRHLKSSAITKGYPLWRLAGGNNFPDVDFDKPETFPTIVYGGEDDPRNKRVLLIGESEGRVQGALSNMKWHILNNQMLQWLFPEIIPDDTNKKGWKWTNEEILLPRSEQYDEGTIRAIGIGKKITGYHGDIFIFDDVIGDTAADSEMEMKSANEWIENSTGYYNKAETVESLYVGTRWKFGTADSYGKLMEELPFVVSEDGRPSGIKWFVYSAIDENGDVAYPERFSHEHLADCRRQLKDYKFSCQYLNTPATPSGSDFPPELLHEFRVEEGPDGRRNKLVPLDGTPPVFLRQLSRITFFDPSSGGKSAGCENAIITLGTASDGRHFILDAFLQNCGYRQAIEKWHQLNDRFVCHKNYYEQVGAQKTIEEFILERQMYLTCRFCGQKHRKLIPVGEKPLNNKQKDDRIRSYLQPTYEEGRIYIHNILIKLRSQIISFPHFDLKDGIDGLAYAIHVARRPSTEEELTDEMEALAAAPPPESRIETAHFYGGYI